jgi:hypothetical protein
VLQSFGLLADFVDHARHYFHDSRRGGSGKSRQARRAGREAWLTALPAWSYTRLRSGRPTRRGVPEFDEVLGKAEKLLALMVKRLHQPARWYRLQSSIPVLTAHCPFAYPLAGLEESVGRVGPRPGQRLQCLSSASRNCASVMISSQHWRTNDGGPWPD